MKKRLFAVVAGLSIFYLIMQSSGCQKNKDIDIVSPPVSDSTKTTDSTKIPLDTIKTHVSGIISTNTLWKAKDSPFNVTGNILVDTGAILTIEPGVQVRFNQNLYMRIDGELVAQGKPDSLIIFTSNGTKAPGYWKQIIFTDHSTAITGRPLPSFAKHSVMQNVILEYAGRGEETKGALTLIASYPRIDNCTIRNNSNTGIFAQERDDTLVISNCIVKNNVCGSRSYNRAGGIYVGGGIAFLKGNTVKDNTQGSSSFGYSAGGICVTDGRFTLTNNTVTGNSSSGTYNSIADAGGICFGNSTSIMTNNIVRQNSGGDVSTHYSDVNIESNQMGNLQSHTTYRDTIFIIKNTILNGSLGVYNEGITSIIENLISECPGTAVNLESLGGMITFQKNTLTRNHSLTTPSNLSIDGMKIVALDNVIEGDSINHESVVFMKGYDLTFKFNTVKHHSANKVFYFPEGNVTLDSNNVYKNNCIYVMYNNGPGVVTATNNWWGTTSESEIQKLVYDYYDDFEKGKVLFMPFATQLFP